ncbi:MAG: hypothetical protein U0637_07200 [Phycisphaerales bacterium]
MIKRTRTLPAAPARRARRRGTGIAALILLLAVLNIAAMGVLAAGTDESDLSVSRAQTIRAFYAAESGGVAVLKLTQSRQTLPTAGSTLNLTNATCTYESVPSATTGGTLWVTATSGDARRRIAVTFTVD